MLTDTTTTVEYIEVTRNHKPLVTWFDKPGIYGEDGYTEYLTGPDLATLYYLYGPRIRFFPMDHADPITRTVNGKRVVSKLYRVTLRDEALEAA